MNFKYDFEFVEMQDEIVAVPVGDGSNCLHGVLKLNKEAKEIMGLMKDLKDENSIVNELVRRFGLDHDLAGKYVISLISKLKENDIIDE